MNLGLGIDSSLLMCPECSGQLEEHRTPEEAVCCVDCCGTWPIDDAGVVRFAPDGLEMNDRDEQFLESLRQTPRDELPSTLADDFPDRYDRFVDPRQSDWWLLGDTPEGIMLDVSGGCGSLSKIVAQQAQAILVVDDDLCRVTTAAVLADKFGLENIIPVHAPPDELPIRSETIDRVFFTGLYSPENRCASRIERIRELLVDGGKLQIRVQNRYSVRRVARDPLGMITESLQEFCSIFGLTATTHESDDEYTLSRWEANRQLTESGFTDIEVEYGLPNAWRPQYLFSGVDSLARYLQNTLRQRHMHRSQVTLWVLYISAQVFAWSSGLVGATAPALFLRGTWRDD